MKNLFALLMIVVVATFCSCQKHLTDEELQARIEREVKRQLAAEREAQEKELEQRRAQFNSRRNVVLDKQAATKDQTRAWDSTSPDSSLESCDSFITGDRPKAAAAPRGHASRALRRHTPGISTDGDPAAGVSASHFENLSDSSGGARRFGIAIRFAVA